MDIAYTCSPIHKCFLHIAHNLHGPEAGSMPDVNQNTGYCRCIISTCCHKLLMLSWMQAAKAVS